MKKHFFLLLTIAINISLFAQGTEDDYKRAFSLEERLKDKVFYSDVAPQWIKKTDKFWYIRRTPERNIYMLVDAKNKTRIELFDHIKLAKLLSSASNDSINPNKLPIFSIKVSTKFDSIQFVYKNNKWLFDKKENSLKKEGKYKAPTTHYWGNYNYERDEKRVISPDKKWRAFLKNNNLFIEDIESGQIKALTSDGTQSDYYSSNFKWSPDSKKLAVMKIHASEIRKISFIESSPKDQLQPKIQTRDYLKPGDSIPQKTPVIIDIDSGKKMVPSTELFENQFSLWGFDWSQDSKTVLFDFNQRGHQAYRVLEMSADNGTVRTIINETSKTFVNYNRYFKKELKNGKEIIWMSERDNWNHLYLYDRLTGKVKTQITKGEWYVREVLDVDETKKVITFSANGMLKNENPYFIRYYKIRFDGTGLICLTPEEGMHKAWFSEDKKYLVDVYSTVYNAPIAVLRSASNGKMIMPLEKADISELTKTGWKAPEPFVAKGRDGDTDIWGIVLRPTNFDPTKKYPVLEYIYAGPGSQYTPKSFFSFNRYLSSIAELGFIVIQLDGMGTSFRSKTFEEVCYKNLKDAGFPDRIAWTKALGEKYQYIDTTRIGIFGASAGGQEAMAAVLFHPEHYKAAYSSCGCHDNRMDKIWWNEQWMGYPVDSSYVASSNVANAHLLTRPLMLVVGEVDDNVDPASTAQVCNALIKANKDFEFVLLPGVGHTMGNEYGEHKRYDFFVKNLMGVMPPAWSSIETKK